MSDTIPVVMNENGSSTLLVSAVSSVLLIQVLYTLHVHVDQKKKLSVKIFVKFYFHH